MEGFIEGESERGVDLIKRRSRVPQLPKDSTSIDVVQEGIVCVVSIKYEFNTIAGGYIFFS